MNPQTQNSIKVYNTAKQNIGNNLCSDATLGCAETVNKIFELALGKPIGGGASTHDMFAFLQNTTKFKEVTRETSAPGDVIISPSGYGNLEHGHVGIVAIYGILSNSSNDGRLHENYDLDTWTQYFHDYGGFPVRFFRII